MKDEYDYFKNVKVVKVECPVCEGKRIFKNPDLFSGTGIFEEECELCKGKGVVEARLIK